MLILIKTRIAAGLVVLLSFSSVNSANAEEIDFSCMSYKVWPKSHLSHQYREFDIVLQNSCPGPVYWSMCIERIDPDNNKVWETLKPGGYVQAGKKARVNIQAEEDDNTARFMRRFEEFYVNLGYAVDSAATAGCFASQCEAKKTDLRAAIRANENAWEKAEKALSARIANECPNSGWETAQRDQCAVDLRESSKEEIGVFSTKDAELRAQMAAIDPDRCKVWSGELVAD
jgi:hypothetical protein